MRVVFAGDWHASSEAAWAAVEMAHDIKADAIFHVGDFLFTGKSKHKFLGSLDRAQRRFNMPLYFVRGNHDDTAFLARKRETLGTVADTPFVPLSDMLFYVPDGSVWEWDGVKIGGLGGAFSVDHNFRTEGRDWWADEVTAWEDVQTIAGTEGLGILVTHDVPDTVNIRSHRGGTPPAEWDIAGAAPNQRAIALAVDGAAPEYHISGHMHTRQTEFITTSSGKTVRSIILDRGDYFGREGTTEVLSNSLLALDLVDGNISPVL